MLLLFSDTKLISQCDIGHGAVLQRVVNADGNHVSLILLGHEEFWSCPTRHEADMIRTWNEMWGWREFVGQFDKTGQAEHCKERDKPEQAAHA